METSRLFMPLLTELGGLGDGFCYEHVAPNGAPRASAPAFQQSQSMSVFPELTCLTKTPTVALSFRWM